MSELVNLSPVIVWAAVFALIMGGSDRFSRDVGMVMKVLIFLQLFLVELSLLLRSMQEIGVLGFLAVIAGYVMYRLLRSQSKNTGG